MQKLKLQYSGNHQSVLAAGLCLFLDPTCKWDHKVFVFVWFISLSLVPLKCTHAVKNDKSSFFL